MFNKDGWKCDVWEELIFDTHEEAELACLAKLIEIAKVHGKPIRNTV